LYFRLAPSWTTAGAIAFEFQVVKDYLKGRGIEDNRLESQWFGKTRPIHDCDQVTCTPAMHQLNRRTELRVGKTSFGYTGRQKKVDTM
jgi:hypothetical protein